MDSGIQLIQRWEWIRFNAPTRHNRSFWGWNLQATNPNQDSQSTEGQNGLLRYKRSSTAGGKDGIGAGYGETWSVADVQLEATLALQFTKNRGHRLDVPPVRLYSRQAGVSGFWCHRLERPASLRRICAVAVFRQRLMTFLFSRSYQDAMMWLMLTLLPFITTVSTPVVLAIINII